MEIIGIQCLLYSNMAQSVDTCIFTGWSLNGNTCVVIFHSLSCKICEIMRLLAKKAAFNTVNQLLIICEKFS